MQGKLVDLVIAYYGWVRIMFFNQQSRTKIFRLVELSSWSGERNNKDGERVSVCHVVYSKAVVCHTHTVRQTDGGR